MRYFSRNFIDSSRRGRIFVDPLSDPNYHPPPTIHLPSPFLNIFDPYTHADSYTITYFDSGMVSSSKCALEEYSSLGKDQLGA